MTTVIKNVFKGNNNEGLLIRGGNIMNATSIMNIKLREAKLEMKQKASEFRTVEEQGIAAYKAIEYSRECSKPGSFDPYMEMMFKAIR